MQRLVSAHKFDLSRYNVLLGEVVVYANNFSFYMFEVGFGASSLLSKHVIIEPGSVFMFKSSSDLLDCLVKPTKGKEISGSVSLKKCSFPTQRELDMYRELNTGI